MAMGLYDRENTLNFLIPVKSLIHMIHSSMQFLTHELNEYLAMRTQMDDSVVKRIYLTGIASEEGLLIRKNSLGMSLINIEEERVYKDQKSTLINNEGIAEQVNPEIKLNLYIIISANFQDEKNSESSDYYVEGLKQLSYVISFFQSKNVFTAENSPSMNNFDPNIKRLVIELYSCNFEQLSNFWTMVGTNYLPSVLYKIRLVRIQEKAVKDAGPPIEKIRYVKLNR